MQGIDRAVVVRRHSITLRSFDPANPLSVGNGEFAFSADVTGLQTFPEAYASDPNHVPLCTMSQWGWHSVPAGPGVKSEDIRYTPVDTYGRGVPYLISAKGQEATFNWLRENPHRLHLGRIGFRLRTAAGLDALPADLSNIEQTLDLWKGLLTSRFHFAGQPVEVETCCAGETDAMAVRVKSPLLADGRLAIVLAFPYGSQTVAAADWTKPDAHETDIDSVSGQRLHLKRTLDAETYHVALGWDGPANFAEVAKHQFVLSTSNGSTELSAVAVFSHKPIGEVVPTFDQAKAASETFWIGYWNSGAAIDLAGSTDPRANELERRVITSQYLMRVNCAGSLPPAETGLTCNSWYGKFHLEMHWWHGVHFALWGRLPLLEKSLSYYERIYPEAEKIARRQGYRGVRWPKMVDGRGIDSPSPVGPLLLWQQPHPIYYAELCYRQDASEKVLKRWQHLVEQTAEFMASFLVRNKETGHYDLGPPLKGVQENNDTMTTRNPTYELTYWRFGLRVAQQWRERLGLPRREDWDDILTHLAPAPHDEGRYLYHEGLTDTYTTWSWEHPAVIGALGMLDGDGIDRDMMRRSVEKTMEVWQWDRTWGWDFPMTAMAAARCGRPDLAIDALLINSIKNRCGPSGHVYQRPGLALYLPANGGLLAAVALMAGGWDGGPNEPAPGFPKTGWTVKAEGFHRYI
jgi:hypothetical protein